LFEVLRVNLIKLQTMKNLISALLVFTLTLGLSSFTAPQKSSDSLKAWTKLGSKKVNYGLDRDVIHVGSREGGFKKLKLKVSGGSLNMHKMIVTYGNGTRDEINVRHNFSRASSSRIIDLNGGKRIIKTITFWYDTKNLARKKSRVTVYGK